MPRWLAEIELQPNFLWPFTLNVWIAVVAHGAAAPLDAAYGLYAGAQSVGGSVVISSTATTAPVYPQAAAILSKDANAPMAFEGANGQRYMMLLRKDVLDSYYPVDPDATILVNLQGTVQANILTISRVSDVVTADVTDVTAFAVGQSINVQGCTTDPTFNGTFVLTAVVPWGNLAPEGALQWSQVASNSADTTGTVSLPAGPCPIAFLPECNNVDAPVEPQQTGYASQDIAAFTVAGGSAAGPFFYLDGASKYRKIKISCSAWIHWG